jgi:SAM-dependent methyltransferase
MSRNRQHWDAIFANHDGDELGWHETDVSQTLKFVDLIPHHDSPTVFLPGAGTSILVDILTSRGHRLILNDISDRALTKLQQRVGADNGLHHYLHHDITQALPDTLPKADIWIDRAVLHFLLTEQEVEAYFANLHAALKPGGHVLLAEFPIVGATKCAGLELHRYSIEEMHQRLGDSYTLIQYEDYQFINPRGESRPYLYALFRRD